MDAEGGRAPESTWYPANTVLVGVAQAKVVEFEAKYPGDYYKLRATIPADEAIRPVKEGNCPMIKE